MNGETRLQPATGHRWRRGFAAVYRAESSKWWGTRRWWVQTLIWMAILNGLLAIVAWGGESEDVIAASNEFFTPFLQVLGAIGISITTQGVIIREKQLGTAQWVLSKPIPRSAFVLAKALATLVAALVIIVLFQSVLAFLQIWVASDGQLSVAAFWATVGMAALHLLFYLTLTLMLGTFFNSREPVIAIAIALIIAQMIQGLLPAVLGVILPYAMVSTATSVMAGEPAPSVAAIIAAPIWALLFTIIAVWRFRREEF
jgi:ABC-2 type transport system permease protein